MIQSMDLQEAEGVMARASSDILRNSNVKGGFKWRRPVQLQSD